MEKFFKNGWGFALIFGIALCVVTFLYMNERGKEVVVADSNPEEVVIPQDSLINLALPLFFADPSADFGIVKMPTEFPAFTDPTSDSGISMTIGEFAGYFKKVFKNTDADQIIITAVETEDSKILRWHIRIHERAK